MRFIGRFQFTKVSEVTKMGFDILDIPRGLVKYPQRICPPAYPEGSPPCTQDYLLRNLLLFIQQRIFWYPSCENNPIS
jgi:hypothetical protein